MRHVKALRVAILIVAILAAWAVGRVQGQQALAEDQYLVIIDAPGGKTNLRCVKGCNWKENWFECSAARCGYGFNQDGFARR